MTSRERRFMGGCHCGAVRFEVVLDLRARVESCMCAMCVKSGVRAVWVPEQAFALGSGMDRLRDYRFGSGAVHHYFCERCGVRSFTEAADGEGYCVNLACLDEVEGVFPARPSSRSAGVATHVHGVLDASCQDALVAEAHVGSHSLEALVVRSG